MSKVISLGSEEKKHNLTVIDTVRENTHLTEGTDGELYLSFSLQVGKGRSPVRVPVSQIDEFLDLIADGQRNVRVEHDSKVLFSMDIVRESLTLDEKDDRQYVSFRTRYGKGSKVQYIPVDELNEVVSVLRTITAEDLPVAIERLRAAAEVKSDGSADAATEQSDSN